MFKHCVRLAFCFLAMGSMLATEALAQALPDLAPREVEIRGELTISFPSLRRQPLVGFNPPPRVPEIDVRRMPFVDAYKQRGAELPQNPLRNPTTPRNLPRAAGDGFTGTFETGFGRYAARYALLEAALFSSPSSRWTIDASYDGTTSWAPFGANAASDGISGGTRYSSTGTRLSYGLEATGSTASYTLFGIDTAGSGGAQAAPSRSRSDIDGSFWLGSGTRSPVSFQARVDGFSGGNKTDIFADASDPRTERSDLGATGHLRLTAGAFRLDGSAGTVSLDPDENASRAIGHFDGGGALRFRLGQATTLLAGGRVLGFEAMPAATGGVRRAATYFSPTVELESALAPNIRLEITQRPKLGSARPGDLFREQPYLADEVHIEPVLYSVDAMARLRGFWSSFQLSAIATYRQSPNWRVFEHAEGGFTGYARGLSSVRHSAARTISVGGEVRLSPVPGLEARLGGRVQDGRLTDLEADLPYFSTWTVDGMISSAFAGRKGLIQATTEILGPRPRGVAGGTDVSLYADLDFRISYTVGRNALLAAELRNLLGETPYWYNYPEAPATVVLGIGWRW